MQCICNICIICICIYTYIYTHTQTHTHKHIQTRTHACITFMLHAYFVQHSCAYTRELTG